MTPDDLTAFTRSRDCTHAGFHAIDHPYRPAEVCPDCDRVLRSATPPDGWADHWAEQRAEERAYELNQLRDREEDARW